MGKARILALAALAVLGMAYSASATTAAEALPPDVFVFIDIPDLPAARASSADTAYGRIMNEPEVKEFIKSGFPALADLARDFQTQVGRNFTEVADFCRGEAAFALLGDRTSGVAGVLTLDLGERRDEFDQFLSANQARSGVVMQEARIPSGTAKWIQLPRGKGGYAYAGNVFVLATSLDTLDAVVSGFLSGRSPNLAEDAAFKKALDAAGDSRAEFILYSDLSRLVTLLAVSAPPSVSEAITGLGLDCLGPAIYTSRAEDKGFVETMWLSFPSGRRGIFDAIRPAQGDIGKFLAMMPSDAISASWTSIDLPRLEGPLTALYNALPADKRAPVDDYVSQLEQASGVALKADVFESLGRNVVTYTPPPAAMMGMALSGGFGQEVTLVELEDPPRLENAFKTLWAEAQRRAAGPPTAPAAKTDEPAPPASADAAAPAPSSAQFPKQVVPQVTFGSEPFGEKTIYEMRVVLNQTLQVVPSMGLKDGWLVIASDPQTVKNAIAAPITFDAGVLQNPDYVSAAAFTGAYNAALSYTDTRAYFDAVYPLVSFGLPLLLGQMGGSVPIGLLPDPQAISPHLFGAASSTCVTDDSIRTVSFGPIGAVRGAYVGGVAGLALGEWFAQAQAEASAGAGRGPSRRVRATETTDMSKVADALRQYAAANGGAYPARLADLVEAGLLSGDASQLDLSGYRLVPGLKTGDDKRLILVFTRKGAAYGRRVLLVGLEIMNLTDEEVAQQAGGWIDLPDVPTPDESDAACLENIAVLGDAAKRFADAHEGKAPASLDIGQWYRFAPLVTRCPAEGAREGADYRTVEGLDISAVPDKGRADVVLVYETPGRHPGGAAVFFLDGTVKRLGADELSRAIERTKALKSSRPEART